AIRTPMDARLAELSGKLAATSIIYGGEDARRRVAHKMAVAAEAPAPAAAERGAYYSKTGGSFDESDALEGLSSGRLPVESLDASKMPAEMRPLSGPDPKPYAEKKRPGRERGAKRISEVRKKRRQN